MRIVVDISHPAHVHYFRNIIWKLQKKGVEFLIIARDKEVTLQLLRNHEFDFYNRGKGRNSIIGKLLYLIKADFVSYREARKFKPDLFLSFGSMYAAHASRLCGRPHIALDDTEHARFQQLLNNPFSDVILTPDCFIADFGSKQIRFKGFMELFYLHPNYYRPDESIKLVLGIKPGEKYAILRFVSWDASHDLGQSGMDFKTKIELINQLRGQMKVFISSEGELPSELHKYKLKIAPERLHDVLAFATLYVGEGATMASECAMLGTPAIYVNSLNAGTLQKLEEYGLLFGFRKSDGVIEKVKELLEIPDLKNKLQTKRKNMLAHMIDATSFMVWFIENYPESFSTLKRNPDFQLEFK